jgi:hypothetical protein
LGETRVIAPIVSGIPPKTARNPATLQQSLIANDLWKRFGCKWFKERHLCRFAAKRRKRLKKTLLGGIVIITILVRFARPRLRQASAFAELRLDKPARQVREEIERKVAKSKHLIRRFKERPEMSDNKCTNLWPDPYFRCHP